MKIEPKIRGFICTTAHPAGCAQNVKQQVEYVKAKGAIQPKGVLNPKNVLVLGCSTGFGLASRIAAAFGCRAATLGVAFERPSSGNRTATAGWYNTAAFEKLAAEDGLYAKTIIGDAFSQEIKDQAVETIRRDLGKVDMVVYSIAAPRRTAPDGTVYNSVLKPVGKPYHGKTIDLKTRTVAEVTVDPAEEDQIRDTVKVMGGEDWKLWIDALMEADALAENAVTFAYSYIGPELTYPIYWDGSIGRAKWDLEKTARELTESMKSLGGSAYVSVNKGLVTQASAAIPVVPLYISVLYKVMKEKGSHEGCIEQIYRLLSEKLIGVGQPVLDEENRLRIDDWEMAGDIQAKIADLWPKLDSGNVAGLADIDGYWDDFYHMFGFGLDGVDYQADVDPDVKIPSIG